jgi:hypothetical protein
MMDFGFIMAIAAFLLNLLITIIGGVRFLSRMEISLRGTIEETRREIDSRLDELADRATNANENLSTRITVAELHVRDNYVRMDTFFKVHEALNDSLKELRVEILARMDRMESKLDNKGAL